MSDGEAGRPRIVNSPEEFDRKVDEYVEKCRREEEPITFTGMALHLGFAARQSLYDYQSYDGFSDSVRRARTIVENEYEKRLSASACTGAIFALKNHGWADRQEFSGPDGQPIEVTDGLSDDQRAARVAALLERARTRRDGQAAGSDADDLS